MDSRVKLFGHPIHTMLVAFPVGLLITAVAFDVMALVTQGRGWFEVAYYLIAAGIIGGLVAAPFGLIDYMGIPGGTRAKSVGARHGIGNVILLVLFAASWMMRKEAPRSPEMLALVLSFAGVVLGAMTSWLGGELVDRLGVGVDEGANLNAPSSLSGHTAHDSVEVAADD